MQAVSTREPSGALAAELIRPNAKRVPRETIERFLALEDLSGTISDVLDKLGVRGAVGTSILRPTINTARIVGTAVTVRNVPQELDALASATSKKNRMTEIEGINQADAGDVLVIQGVRDVSNMGGIMSSLAKRQQIAGAVVDGGVRDVGQSRSIGFPVWSRDISPITGKWRCVTVEVNGTVNIAGIPVRPGDLVIADETGACFVPQRLIDQVLQMAEAVTEQERSYMQQLEHGLPIRDFARDLYGRGD
ncbi:MAG TPA: RraA family protein [Burkholderiaceae bacterium]|nr:RraA family protein [Burkholderiaceae bacterium]